MESKSEKRSINSQTILRQLQENQSLRIEVFRLRTSLRDQHHSILTSTINQQMLAEKILTALSLAYRRCRSSKVISDEQQILVGAVKNCVGDLQGLLEGFDKFKGEWGQMRYEDADVDYERLLHDCSARFQQAEEVIKTLSHERDVLVDKNEITKTQIQFLQQQLGRIHINVSNLEEKVDVLMKQKDDLSKQRQTLLQKYSDCQETISKLERQNEVVHKQLRQSREIANKHAEYAANKCKLLENENACLVKLQRDWMARQQQLLRSIDGKNKEIAELNDQIRNQLDNQGIADHLQSRNPLSEIKIEQNIDNQQSRPLRREVGKMTKKFNLQSFQQKLSTYAPPGSFYLH